MKDFVESAILLSNSGIFVVLLFFTISILRDPKALIQTLDIWKSSKTSALELALKSQYLKGSSRKLIENKLVQRHVYLSTGLDIEEPVREKILAVHSYSAGSVRFQHFIRAQKHYKFDHSVLSLNWGRSNTLSLWLFGFSAVASLFLFLVLIITLLIGMVDHNMLDQSDIRERLPLIMALLTTGVFYLHGWIVLASTNIVRKEVEAYYESGISEANKPVNLESSF
jgi:hypothetical protein